MPTPTAPTLPPNQRAPPPRLAGLGRSIRDAVYGATDGTVTTFAAVSFAAVSFAAVSDVKGTGLSPRIVLILGAANPVGDGFSMAAGNDLATQAERQRIAPDSAGSSSDASPDPRIAAAVTFATFAAAGAVPLLPDLYGRLLSGVA